jgi:hypothetical protein
MVTPAAIGQRVADLRRPPPEVQQAGALRRVDHSAGLVITCTDSTGDEGTAGLAFSFLVTSDEQVGRPNGVADPDDPGGPRVVELAGWGWSGPTPEIHVNPPADPRNVHTVLVESVPGPETFACIRELIDEHVARYRECSVWTADVPLELTRWVAAGCPGNLEAPTAEELAEAQTLKPPESRTEMSGIGWDTSEPIGQAISFEEAEAEVEAHVADAVAEAKAKGNRPVGREQVESEAAAMIQAKVAAAKAGHEIKHEESA